MCSALGDVCFCYKQELIHRSKPLIAPKAKFKINAGPLSLFRRGMSALGQKQTFPHVYAMSGLLPKADIK